MHEKFESDVLEIIKLNDSVKHLKIFVPSSFDFIPGQYVSIIYPGKDRKIRRPYSICSSPNEKGYVDLCIKIIENGILTPIINEFEVGEKLEVLGPLGEFTIKNYDKDIIFISTGTGIGPFRSMIKYLLEKNFEHNITLMTGYKDENHILYDQEFLQLQEKHGNFSYETILSQPLSEKYKKGHVQDLIKDFTPSKEGDYYICGLKDMIISVRGLLNKKGVDMKDIYSEKYD